MADRFRAAVRAALPVARGIDRFTQVVGWGVMGCTLAMVLVGAFNAVARYTDRFTGLELSANTYLELQWYLFSIVFLLGAAYALKEGAHVRVDVLYTRLSRRGKAWVDLLGTLLFLLPFCVLMLWTSWPAVANSWAVWEQSPDPGGLPRWPIKTMVLVAFVLLVLQGGSMLVRNAAVLAGVALEDEAVPDDDEAVPDDDPFGEEGVSS